MQALVVLYLQARRYSVLEFVLSGLLKIRISGSSGACITRNCFAECACPASLRFVIPTLQGFRGSLLGSPHGIESLVKDFVAFKNALEVYARTSLQHSTAHLQWDSASLRYSCQIPRINSDVPWQLSLTQHHGQSFIGSQVVLKVGSVWFQTHT